MIEALIDHLAERGPSITEVIFLFNAIFASLLGYLIGAERESRGKDAGISTHMLVILGAMLFTFLSSIVDPASKSRIAAQIVSGIGFLGAGLILKDGATVRNLTTAASIWFAGAIGMAIGFGYYFIASVASLVSIIVPRIPHVRYHAKKKTQGGGDDSDNGRPAGLSTEAGGGAD
jgi:putative Mg2+ transporter-C (MgtC) family protein